MLEAIIWLQLILHANAQAFQQPPTFNEVEREIKVVGLTRDLDKIVGWIAQDPNEFDKALEFARHQKNSDVLLREMLVAGARHSSWEKVQQVVQEIDRTKRKPGYMPQAPLASVQIFGVYSDPRNPRREIAFLSAMNAIETCERNYSKSDFLTTLTTSLKANDKYWQETLAAFASVVKKSNGQSRESQVYRFLEKTAEHGTDLQISEAVKKLEFAIESDTAKVAVARGLFNGSRYAEATSRAADVKSPSQRAAMILRFLRDYKINKQGKLADANLIFAELKRAVDQAEDGEKKIDLLLGYFERVQKFSVKVDAESFHKQLKDFVLGLEPNQVSSRFSKIGRAYVVFRGLNDSEGSAAALRLLEQYAASKSGIRSGVTRGYQWGGCRICGQGK